MTALPEKLAPGIYRVDALPFKRAVSVFLIAERDGWTLIDTGVPASVERILAALASLGGEPATLRRIFLTHHHSDHIGGLAGLAERVPGVEVVAPTREAEIVSGERPPDPSENAILRALTARQQFPAHPVARTLDEGDEIGGFRLVPTPGHTLGHVSLLHEGHRLLLLIDAYGQLFRGLQVGVTKPFCTDPALARRSAERLLDLDFAVAVPSHGPVLRENAKEHLRAVVARNDW